MSISATLVQPGCRICRNATVAKTNVAYSTLAARFPRFLNAVHSRFIVPAITTKLGSWIMAELPPIMERTLSHKSYPLLEMFVVARRPWGLAAQEPLQFLEIGRGRR